MTEQSTEATAAEPTETQTSEPGTEEAGEQQATKTDDDWQAKFEAQQKINRDLEAKLKKSAQNDGHARAKELEAKLAKFEGREAEYQAEQEKRAAEQQALAKANDRIRRSEVKAAAKGVLADPADAYKFLDLESFEVDDDGNVDESAIADALAELVKSKPYLAVQDGKRFQGDADAGTRKEARPAQLTQADLGRMTPEEIGKARREGRLNDLMGVRT